MPVTPDDLYGGITNAILLRLIDGAADPASAGEIANNGGLVFGRDSAGVFPLRPGGVIAPAARTVGPADIFSTLSGSFVNVTGSTLAYAYDPLNGCTTKRWFAAVDVDAGTTGSVRITRRSDGAVVAAATSITAAGFVTLAITDNLPSGNDRLTVQLRRLTGIGNVRIMAGLFEFFS